MAIAARCPKCLTLFHLDDALDGKLVRCKKCQEMFVVGAPGPASAPSGDHETPSGIRARRDDRYQDDNPPPPPPAPAIPRKWLILGGAIGGAALLFLVLLLTAVSSLQSTDKKTSSAPRPAPADLNLSPPARPAPAVPPAPKYGPEQTVTVQIGDIADESVRRVIEQKLEALADARPATLQVVDGKGQGPTSGRNVTLNLAPVRDPGALAKKIDFATLLGVDGRVLRLSARGILTATNQPTGPIRPQVTAPFELPPSNEERPTPLSAPLVWQVKPDPPAETGSKGQTSGIRLTKAPIQLPGLQRALCPTTPSLFVAVGAGIGAGAGVQLFNLQTMKAGKRLTIPSGLVDPLALSPDGVFIAGRAGPAAGVKNAIIDVLSFNTGKRVQALTLPEGRRAGIELIDFTRTGQLVVMKSDLGRRNVQVWDVEKAEVLREWIGPSSYQPNSAALSPNRKYLTAGDKDKLWIYDLDAGHVAAAHDLGGTGQQSLKYDCFGLAFSPDGAELAGVFEAPLKSRLICWDIAKGEVLADHIFDKRLNWNYQGPPVEWLPDRTAILLYGRFLIEHQTGRLVYEVPGMEPGSNRQIRVLGADRILETDHGFQGVALQILPLPVEQVQAAIETTRKAWDALKLPAAQPGDWSAARAVAAPATVKWSVLPDAVPFKADRFTSRPITLLQRDSDIQRVLFANADAAVAAVLSDVTPNQLFAKKVLRVERYDVTRGQSLGGVNLCIDPQYRAGLALPSDLSGDGSRLVLTGCQDPRRVDVWSGEGKHFAGWVPYAQETSGTIQAEPVTWVRFLGSKRVYTLNAAGKLVLWSLPEAKAQYVLSNVNKDSAALSPSQKYLAVAQDGAYRLYEAATGTPAGVLPWTALAPASNANACASFSPDGGLLAAVTGGAITCWDLKSGKEVASFPVGQELSNLRWAGTRYLVAHSAAGQPHIFVIDVEQQQTLCWYRLPGANAVAGSPDGRLWYLQGSANQCALLARSVPDAAAVNIDSLARSPSAQVLLRPGMPVALRVDIAGNDMLRLQITETLQKRLQAAGFNPSDGTPVVLSFQTSLTSASDMGKEGRTGGVPAAVSAGMTQKLTSVIIVGDNRGTAWWRQESNSKPDADVPESPRKDSDSRMREHRLWQGALQFAEQVPLPSRVYLVNGQPLVLPMPLTLSADGR